MILPLLISAILAGGLVGLLLKVVIACIVIWAIYALLTWAGIAIPRPVQILLIALGSILAVYWLYEIFLQLA